MEAMILPFIMACATNNAPEVQQFITKHGISGAAVNLMDGSNGFLCACQEGNIDIVKLLVIAGYDLDFKNIFGITGFMKACYYGRYEIIEYLLQFNVDVNTQDNNGSTTLMEGTNSSSISTFIH